MDDAKGAREREINFAQSRRERDRRMLQRHELLPEIESPKSGRLTVPSWYDAVYLTVRGLFSLYVWGDGRTHGEGSGSMISTHANPLGFFAGLTHKDGWGGALTSPAGGMGAHVIRAAAAAGSRHHRAPGEGESMIWLKLSAPRSGFSYESTPRPFESDQVVLGDAIIMPLVPLAGDVLQIDLMDMRSAAPIGSCRLRTSRSDLGEGHERDFPALQLLGNMGQLVGYVHVVAKFRTESKIGFHRCAVRIQAVARGYLLRARRVQEKGGQEEHERPQSSRSKERSHAARRKTLEQRTEEQRRKEERKSSATLLQTRWRGMTTRRHLATQLSLTLSELDIWMLRRPFRLYLVQGQGSTLTQRSMGGRITFDLDGCEFAYLPPTDVISVGSRAAGQLTRTAAERGALYTDKISRFSRRARTRFSCLRRQPPERAEAALAAGTAADMDADLVVRQRCEAAEQKLQLRLEKRIRRIREKPSVRDEDRDSLIAWEVLRMGKPLPITSIARVDVASYALARLRLRYEEHWCDGQLIPAGRLLLECHSSASLLVWLRLLQASVQAKRSIPRIHREARYHAAVVRHWLEMSVADEQSLRWTYGRSTEDISETDGPSLSRTLLLLAQDSSALDEPVWRNSVTNSVSSTANPHTAHSHTYSPGATGIGPATPSPVATANPHTAHSHTHSPGATGIGPATSAPVATPARESDWARRTLDSARRALARMRPPRAEWPTE